METAICGRLALSPNPLFNAKTGGRYTLYMGPLVVSARATATAPGVLDKPITEKTTPGRDSEFDLRKSRKTAPPYRVMLHNDNHNRRDYVVQVLIKVIAGMTVDIAYNIMQEAHYNGLAVVIICAQADAEDHCTRLRSNGLLSSIEPATGAC